VDELARWHDLGEHLAEGGESLGGPDVYGLRRHADERWGEPPVVAVVYAIGECAMDSGIRGRRTGAFLRALADDPAVRAVVLRADSPGGDPLPSDLVDEGVRRLREAGKPVIVSQGDVAASGGYWISMNGTEVLTTPLTITGSIGVIAGWVWDESLHEKIGVNADGVSQGAHADLFRNVRYPLLDVAVPARAMTEPEEAMARDRILEMYDRFVDAVAAGRGLEPARVREIGGGRVWMGPDAVELGLCDGIGGLGAAVDRARELAGIAVGERVTLREYPPRPLFEMPQLGLPFLGLSVRLPGPWSDAVETADGEASDLSVLVLRRLAETGGRPLLFTPPDALPEAWRTAR
jgi:protease-4